MNYLYHMVPENMIGNTLYPLNKLKDHYPEIYKKEMKRYGGRESLFQVKLPYLNCGWKDVLHFIAIPPEMMSASLKEAGFPFEKIKWFKIDPYVLDKNKAIVYLYKNKPAESRYDSDNFAKFAPDKLLKFSEMPEKTLNYYRSDFDGKKVRPGFKFHFVPHILYKGSISIKDVEVIEI